MRFAIRFVTVLTASLFGVACNDVTPPRANGGAIGAPDANSTPLSNSKMAQLRQYSDGGCAFSAADATGQVRGLPVRRQLLPFSVPAIQHNALTNQGNGRVAHVMVDRPHDTPVALSCWIPNTVTTAALAQALQTAKTGRWAALLKALKTANTVPDSAHRTLSPEATAFRAEMLAPVPAAQQNVQTVAHPNYETGCESVTITWNAWSDDEETWDTFTLEVDVCSYDDAFGYLIDNGYDPGTTVAVDASEYQITAGDSVTFHAEIASSRLVGRIGWTWTPTGGGSADPLTTACTGNDTTCTIQVHATGTMTFTIYDYGTATDQSGDIGVGAAIPPAVDSLYGGPFDVADSSSAAPSFATNEISAATGAAILDTAQTELNGNSGNGWIYTQGCASCTPGGFTESAKNLAAHYGDCTDFVWWVVSRVLKTAWPYDSTRIPRTEKFGEFTSGTAGYYGYVLKDSTNVRMGDVVVQDTVISTSPLVRGKGHAGIYHTWGFKSGIRYPIAYANNGQPAIGTSHANSDSPLARFHFRPAASKVVLYFRPATP